MIQIIKPLRSGQITIPVLLREKLGIASDSLLQIRLVEGELRLKPVKIMASAGDTDWFKKLYTSFTPVRKEAQTYSEKAIDQAIKKAVRAVRRSHA